MHTDEQILLEDQLLKDIWIKIEFFKAFSPENENYVIKLLTLMLIQMCM